MMVASRLHVVAAAILDGQGRVLLAQRPRHKHQGGLWEFPGGKVEPGEAPAAALARELSEELGITPSHARPFLTIPYDYPDKSVLLDVWQVTAWDGAPHGREGQPVVWAALDQLAEYAFPAANRPIVTALQLPDCYVISADCPPGEEAEWLAALTRTLANGAELILARCPSLSRAAYLALLSAALERVREEGGKLMAHGEPALLAALPGLAGVHLPARALAQYTTRPALPAGSWLAVSVHDADELKAAEALGADFVTLSPVQATTSHPEAVPLGWPRFAELVARSHLPVFALGGVNSSNLEAAWTVGARGVAGIRGFWRHG